MANLIILVGIPGCGKSTWAKNLLDLQYQIVSSDEIREKIFGNATDQSNNAQVFDLFHAQIDLYLAYGLDVVADSTALDKFARENLYQIGAHHNATIHLVVFKNVIQAIERNKRRERVVPPEAMYKMLSKYERMLAQITQEHSAGKTKTLVKIGSVE